MTPEGHKPSENIIPLIAVLGAVALLSQFAFSYPVRKIIRERDHNRCVVCGSTGECDCAHISHDRNNPLYNDPSNGRLLCLEDHLKDHINRHGRNGLTKEQNIWSIKKLKERIGL